MDYPDDDPYICPRHFYEFTECVITMRWVTIRLLAQLSGICRDTYILLHATLQRRRQLRMLWAPRLARAFARRCRIPRDLRTNLYVGDEAFADTAGPTRVLPGTDRSLSPHFSSVRRITILATQAYAFYLIVVGCGKPIMMRVFNWTLMPTGCMRRLTDRQPGQKTPAGAYVTHVDLPIMPIVRTDDVIAYMATRAHPTDDWAILPDLELMWEVITHVIIVHEGK